MGGGRDLACGLLFADPALSKPTPPVYFLVDIPSSLSPHFHFRFAVDGLGCFYPSGKPVWFSKPVLWKQRWDLSVSLLVCEPLGVRTMSYLTLNSWQGFTETQTTPLLTLKKLPGWGGGGGTDRRALHSQNRGKLNDRKEEGREESGDWANYKLHCHLWKT